MEVILNIRLNTPTGATIEAIDAVQAVAAAGLHVISTEVFQADTAPTLVATVRDAGEAHHRSFDDVAARLQQDCIAVYSPVMAFGTLIGPRSAQWLPFNPRYFTLPSGQRLAA